MRTPPSRVVLVTALGLMQACCPIPIDREVSVRPQLDIRVADAAGAPVPGAVIYTRRQIVGPPPVTETHRWKGNTGPKGRVVLEALTENEPHMPLMMHGVNWYGWQVCAEHDSQAGTAEYNATEPVVAGGVTLEVALSQTTTCTELWTQP